MRFQHPLPTPRQPSAWRLGIALACVVACAASAAAQPPGRRPVPPGPADVPPRQRPAAAPADYRSPHFVLHTDMAPADARKLLNRLETMLSLIADYWGQPLPGEIECYVVRDLDVWPADALPPAGRAKIEVGAGVTTTEALTRGPRFVSGKSVVYSIADEGTPQHEAVHAYCGQTFGTTGPLWYSEGMAELGKCWRRGESGVACAPHVVEYLRQSPVRTVREIVSEDGTPERGAAAARTGDSWQSYAWRWALCHLLVNNPNYADRFRALGLGFLNGSPAHFRDAFGPAIDEIDFEYRFFLAHLEQGYRVDLCRWDWDAKFREPEHAVRSRIMARRGWQPSGALVSRGQQYDYRAAGQWQLDDGPAVSADGTSGGRGQLQGVILHDDQLGEPFALGATGTWTAPADGRLYLRCADAWTALADNAGFISVRIEKTPAKAGDQRPATPAPAAAGVD